MEEARWAPTWTGSACRIYLASLDRVGVRPALLGDVTKPLPTPAEQIFAIMETVTLCGPSRIDPVVLRPAHLEAVSLLQPTLDYALKFQRLLSAASLFIVLRTYFVAAFVASWTAFVSKTLAVFTFKTLRTIIRQSGWAIATVYKTKTVRRMRKRLEFEMGMLILGPGMNTMIIMVFWPGWWFIGGALVAAKMLVG